MHKLTNLQYNVFISKQSTQEICDYICDENWGKCNILLYKYLDYMWRLNIINNNIIEFKYNKEKRLIFNTGLYTKRMNEILYLCLVPNTIYTKFGKNRKPTQSWKVTLGNQGYTYNSLMTKRSLMILHNINECDIPTKLDFDPKNKVKFNPEYQVIINMPERIRTSKDRIYNQLLNEIGFNDISVGELTKLIKNSIDNTIYQARKNPNISAKQVFIERDLINNIKCTKGYHLELLLPLTVTVNYKNIYFAVALRENKELKMYEVMSIITREMAYSNSRLVGYVTQNWLKPFVNTNKIDNNCKQNSNELLNPCHYLFNNNYIDNPFIYLNTILPLKLPQLNRNIYAKTL